VSRAATLEQQQAEANRKTEEMEKELSESRLTIVQVGLTPVSCHFPVSGAFCPLDPDKTPILNPDFGSANYISENLVPMVWVKDT
jgi:hypothetical protein